MRKRTKQSSSPGRPVSVYLDERCLEAIDAEVADQIGGGQIASRSSVLRALIMLALTEAPPFGGRR